MQRMLLAMGLLVGIAVAYIDSQPSWNDAGIIAGGLLLTSGILTLAGFRRPWLMALAVGLWIPARTLYVSHDASTLLVVLFALVGAYLGWAVRRGLDATLHRAS
jgi:hypothetical protein